MACFQKIAGEHLPSLLQLRKSAFLPDASADPDFDTINDIVPAKNRTVFPAVMLKRIRQPVESLACPSQRLPH
ncbi:MAG: hypothetical protein DMG88_17535 [Acidobacteria bacterium]|nr:MAG: hypothetical protein DMG88_17535 [Acidobacteriota bacterium]